MDDLPHALLAAIGFLTMVGLSGAALTYGVASVGRWMKWAPINIIVNVYRTNDESD